MVKAAGGAGGGAADGLFAAHDQGLRACDKDMMMKFNALPLLILPLLVSACATAEYRQEANICQALWLRTIPPSYHDKLVEQYRAVQRPTGRSVCITRGNRTVCEEKMRTEYVPYTAVVTVDRYKGERDAEISNCTLQACVARMGNAECE